MNDTSKVWREPVVSRPVSGIRYFFEIYLEICLEIYPKLYPKYFLEFFTEFILEFQSQFLIELLSRFLSSSSTNLSQVFSWRFTGLIFFLDFSGVSPKFTFWASYENFSGIFLRILRAFPGFSTRVRTRSLQTFSTRFLQEYQVPFIISSRGFPAKLAVFLVEFHPTFQNFSNVPSGISLKCFSG